MHPTGNARIKATLSNHLLSLKPAGIPPPRAFYLGWLPRPLTCGWPFGLLLPAERQPRANSVSGPLQRDCPQKQSLT